MRRKGSIAFLAVALLVAQNEAAAQGGGDFGGGGGRNNGDGVEEVMGDSTNGGISSEVTYSNSAGDTEPLGIATPTSDWEPPPCWFEPRSASEARDYVQTMLRNWVNIPEEDIAPSRDRLLNHFVNGDPYENYNLDNEDSGAFWFGVSNPNRLEHPDAFSCSERLPEWVEHEDTPDETRSITPEILAQSAYEWLPLPETDLSLNPAVDVPQTVYLPTWIWQETADIGEVSATARLESLGIEATTVATPSALTLDPGTEDATVHPADGECVINDDGTIGERYDGQSAEEEPPCGVTYTHSTADGEPYELTATITWSVSWTGTGNPEAQPLPNAVLETTHQLTVQEVQAIVR